MKEFNPFDEMIDLYNSTNRERIKLDILTELCGYIAPKLKSMEITPDKDNPFIINLNVTPKLPAQVAAPAIEQVITKAIEHEEDEDED